MKKRRNIIKHKENILKTLSILSILGGATLVGFLATSCSSSANNNQSSPQPENPKPEQPKPEQPKPEQPKPENPKPENPKPPAPEPEQPKPPAPQPDNTNKINLIAIIDKEFSIEENQKLQIIPRISSPNIDINDSSKYKFTYKWLYRLSTENQNQFKVIADQNKKDFVLNSTPINYNGRYIKLEVSLFDAKTNQKLKTIFSNETLIKVNPLNKNDWTNIGIEGVDYFYLPNTPHDVSNRITIKTTQNEAIKKKYGTVPLPWKEDAQITDTDIKNMFTIIVIARYDAIGVNTNLTDLNFGARNLDANKMAIHWANWILEYWNVFPYLKFDNGALAFGLKEKEGIQSTPNPMARFPVLNGIINKWTADPTIADQIVNKTQYFVKDFNATGTAGSAFFNDDILRPSRIREKFYNLLIYLFSQIRPNMSDIDKFLTTFLFTVNWLQYDPGGMLTNSGVCADYSSMLAMCLNAIGIKALPMVSNVQKKAAGISQVHQVVWVYLDPYNYDPTIPGNPKWYMCDPTFFDTAGWGNNGDNKDSGFFQISKPSSMMGRNNFKPRLADSFSSALDLLLRSPSNSQFTTNGFIAEYTYSQFFMAPWNVYSQNHPIGEVRTGEYSYYSEQNESKAPNSFLFIEPNSVDSGQIIDRLPPKWYPKDPNEPWKSNWNFQRRYSRTVFNNGYYYWLVTTADFGYSDAQNLETYLVRAKAGAVPTETYQGTAQIPKNYGNKYEPIEKVYVPDNLVNVLLTTPSQQLPVLQQWNNWIIFLQREEKKLILFQFNNDGIDWASQRDIILNANMDYSTVIDFYIDFDGKINFLMINDNNPSVNIQTELRKWGSNSIYSKGAWDTQLDPRVKIVSETLSLENKNLIFNIESNKNLLLDDVKNAYNFFFMFGGTSAIGHNNFEVSVEKRKQYYANLKTQLNLANNNTSNNLTLIKKMNNIYNEYNNSTINPSIDLPLISTHINSKYYIPQEIYNEVGFNSFQDFKIYMNFDEMMNKYFNNSTKYNIYFNKSNSFSSAQEFIKNPSTKTIIKDSYSPFFDKKLLADPYGYYVLEVYNSTVPNKKIISNIVELVNGPDLYNSGKLNVFYEDPEIKTDSQITNYSVNNKTWFEQSIKLWFDWNLPLGFQCELNYINLDTKEIKVIYQSSPIYPGVQQGHIIGMPNSDNHGIYYFRVYNGEMNLYTNFAFIATKDDIDNYDSAKWSEIISIINKQKSKLI